MMVDKKFPHIAKDLKADGTSKITGDVYINRGCEFESNVVIDGSDFRVVIGSNCSIGQDTLVKAIRERIVVGDGVNIGRNCKIFSNIGSSTDVGDEVIIEDETQIGQNCVITGGEKVSKGARIPENSIFQDGVISPR